MGGGSLTLDRMVSYSEHAVVDGDRHESQEEEDDISKGFLPIGRYG